MAGLEALGAFGLACNVFQAVSFAKEVCMVARTILETGETPDSATSLANSMGNLAAITTDIESSTSLLSQPLRSNETRMLQIAQDCSKAALELKVELDNSTVASSSAKGNRLKSFRVALGSVVHSRSKKVERLEKRLQTHQNTLETQLLVNSCSKADAAKLCQQDEFNKVDSTLRDFVKRYSEGETRMVTLLTQQSESLKSHVTTKTAGLATAINDLAVESKKAAETLDGAITDSNLLAKREKERERLLGSLRYPTMDGRRNQIVDPHAETFEWIFAGPQLPDGDEEFHTQYEPRNMSLVMDATARFSDWLRDPAQSIFWISGKPGSGKSTLVKFLVDDPRTRTGLTSGCEPRDVVLLSHFIWSAGQAVESSVKGMLCTLIHQFLEENDEMSDRVLDTFPKTKFKHSCSGWSEKELKSVLLFLLGDSTKAFCLFIDGLDEISASDGQTKLLELIREMQTTPKLKMCVSSRPEPVLEKYLGVFPKLRMQDLVHADIFNFTSDILKMRLIDNSIALSTAEHQILTHEVCGMAEGVFLWVVLAVRNLVVSLNKGDGMKELKQLLALMPSELRDLYKSMWDRLGMEKQIYQRDAATYFNLVLLQNEEFAGDHDGCTPLKLLLAIDNNFADRALMVTSQSLPSEDELRVLSNEMAHRIKVRSLGFLDISTWEKTSNEMTIGFIHRSAKEFLQTDAEGQALLERDTSTKQERRFRVLKAQLGQSFLYHLGDISIAHHHNMNGAERFIWDIIAMRKQNSISRHQAIQLSLLSRPLFEPYRTKYTNTVHTSISFPDLLGVAAQAGYWRFLQQAVEQKPLSIPYVSYLLTMALQDPGPFEEENKEARGFRTVRWILKHDVDPNFPTRPYDDGEHFSIPTTPLKALIRRLMHPDSLLNCTSPFINILRTLAQSGGDLSSTLILVVQQTGTTKVRLNMLSPTVNELGVYIEVKTALVLELLVRKFTRHNMADPRHIEQILAVLETIATPDLSVRNVTVDANLYSERKWRCDSIGRSFHRVSLPFWNTDDSACLSRVERHLKGDPEYSSLSLLPREPSQCKDDCTGVMEFSRSWLRDMIKDAQETGNLTTWGDVQADWCARDHIWELDDPRRKIPRAWDV